MQDNRPQSQPDQSSTQPTAVLVTEVTHKGMERCRPWPKDRRNRRRTEKFSGSSQREPPTKGCRRGTRFPSGNDGSLSLISNRLRILMVRKRTAQHPNSGKSSNIIVEVNHE